VDFHFDFWEIIVIFILLIVIAFLLAGLGEPAM